MAEKSSFQSLRAGAAQVDITPALGVQLAGQVGERRPVQNIYDPLFAKALVLESNGRKLCIVSMDVTMITRPYTEQIRDAAQNLGIEREAVMVHATQNHNAPGIGAFMFDEDFHVAPEWGWVALDNPEYCALAVAGAIKAIEEANEKLQRVAIASGSGVDGRVAFNRRGVMRDGMVMMPGHTWPEPLGWTQIKYLEGPIDPEVGVLALRNEAGQYVAMLLHHTCHPVHLFWRGEGIVTADWCGAWCDQMKAEIDDEFVPLVINGCCGNINPWNPFDPDYKEDHVLAGKNLAQTAQKVLQTLEWRDEAPLDCSIRNIGLPVREVPAQRLKDAQRYLAEHPEPKYSSDNPSWITHEWMSAAMTQSVHLCRERSTLHDYEIQAFRIGDFALVGLPGEPFAEGQLEIKMNSPAERTFVAHCTSHYIGYLPTREGFPRGGHEAALNYWAKLEIEALEMVVENTTKLLREVFVESS